MVKSKPDASLKGKRPTNKATSTTLKSRPQTTNPSHIRNKLKRSEMYGKYLLHKKTLKRRQRIERAKTAEALGDDVPLPKNTPKTLENTREIEPTTVHPHDPEVRNDESTDEFADYFSDVVRPKILVTTRPRPSKQLFYFIGDLMRFVPNLFFYPRRSYSVKDICEHAVGKGFTHLMVLSEKGKVCNGMMISHLRRTGAAVPNSDGTSTNNDDDDGDDKYGEECKGAGPTAFFKVSNVVTSTNIPEHGSATSHVPELVLNGFGTRLGHRVGRFLGSIFPHNAQFRGRQVATFHNQRDYIFVRHHRYVFEEGKEAFVEPKKDGDGEEGGDEKKKEKPSESDDEGETSEGEEDRNTKKGGKEKKKTKARLQELGPRFTLKLKWIQEGTFDTQFGEYEWYHKRKEMDTTRRKFHL